MAGKALDLRFAALKAPSRFNATTYYHAVLFKPLNHLNQLQCNCLLENMAIFLSLHPVGTKMFVRLLAAIKRLWNLYSIPPGKQVEACSLAPSIRQESYTYHLPML